MSEETTEEGLNLDKLIRVYLKIKAKKEELAAAHKEEVSGLTEKLDFIKEELLKYCKDNNSEGSRTTSGTFYRTTKVKYWTSDWSEFHAFVLEHKVPDLLDKRVNQTNMKQFMIDNPDLIPRGLNVDSEYTMSIRKAKK